MYGTLQKFLRDRTGATAIEYVLVASLISIVAIGGATAIGDSSILKLEGVADKW